MLRTVKKDKQVPNVDVRNIIEESVVYVSETVARVATLSH